MAMIRCPDCKKPAILTDSREIGETYVPEVGAWMPVLEQRIACPAPAGCGKRNTVHVVHVIKLYRGTSEKRTVPRLRPERCRRRELRTCGRTEVYLLPAPRRGGAKS